MEPSDYEILESDSAAVREQWPECRRVRNKVTGAESQLLRDEEEATEVIRLACEGGLLGSFA